MSYTPLDYPESLAAGGWQSRSFDMYETNSYGDDYNDIPASTGVSLCQPQMEGTVDPSIFESTSMKETRDLPTLSEAFWMEDELFSWNPLHNYPEPGGYESFPGISSSANRVEPESLSAGNLWSLHAAVAPAITEGSPYCKLNTTCCKLNMEDRS
jgi:hypothetical protein